MKTKDDTYAIRCFVNNKRKKTDKLTQEEAMIFIRTADCLIRYLEKEHNLVFDHDNCEVYLFKDPLKGIHWKRP